MWLYVPPTSACSLESLGSTLESPSLFQTLAASCTSSGKSAQPASLRRAWKTGAWKLLRFGPTSARLTDFSFAAEWMESLADSPARTSASLESKPESRENIQDSGSNTSESFAKFNPDGSLSKTSLQFSLFPQEQPYSEGLPKAGSMRSGFLFERPTWERPTAEKEFSCWPTATVGDGESGQTEPNGNRQGGADHESLRVATAQWPSPRSEDSECAGNHPGATDSLTGASKIWKTPHGMAGMDKTGKAGGGGEFALQANQWQMPATDSFRSCGGDRKDEMGLDQEARTHFGGTPTSRDHKDCDVTNSGVATNHLLGREASRFSRLDQPTPSDGETCSTAGPGSRRRLNPAFAAMLMAWPWWWTHPEPIASAQSAMASWRSKVRRHLSNYLAAPVSNGGGGMSKWSTPQARDWKGECGRSIKGLEIDLPMMVKEWATPNAHDATGARGVRFALTDCHSKPHDLCSQVEGT